VGDGSDIVAIVSAVIAGIALLVSGGSLWFARRADRRADRGQPSAQFVGFADLEGRSREDADYIAVMFRVRNVGAAGARHVTVNLLNADGSDLGVRSTGVSLAAGDIEDMRVGLPQPGRCSYPLRVRLEWSHWDAEQEQQPYTRISQQRVPDPFLPSGERPPMPDG
jgi:hypothetical protein